MKWYQYLTEEFRLNMDMYKSRDKAVVDCRCGSTTIIKVGHLKSRVKELGYFICSKCRKVEGACKAREKKKAPEGA